MSTRVRKRSAAAASDKRCAGLRKDVQEAIGRVWPDDIVEMPFDSEDSYFSELHPKLSRALGRIKSTSLIHERGPVGEPVWFEDSDPDEDPPNEVENSRSYHTFFVSPDGKEFTFEAETGGFPGTEFQTDDFEEDSPEGRIPGTGRNGWVVAVSLLTPFAVVELGDIIDFEDGSQTEPQIESHYQFENGKKFDPGKKFRDVYGVQAHNTMMSLRAKIAGILEGLGITVLPASEWRKPVPGMRGAEETLIGLQGQPVRVLDAFFFESI